MADRLTHLFILTEKRRNRLEVGALPEFMISSILYCSRSSRFSEMNETFTPQVVRIRSRILCVGAVCR